MKRFQPFRVICLFAVVFFVLGSSLIIGAEKIPRIAVLEITNLQPDKDTDWIGGATAETLSSKLCGVSSISVVERRRIQDVINEQRLQLLGPTDLETAVEVGKLVGADIVVVGSYVSYAGQVQFNVRFVDVETGEVRNAASLTGEMSEIFQLNYKLAEAAIESLNKRIVIIEGAPVVKEVSGPKKVKLSRKEKQLIEKQWTTSQEAYQYFGWALKFWKAGNLDKEIELYTRAIQLDPSYLLAYFNRGLAYHYGKKDYNRAIADYTRAIKLDPKYARAYFSRGDVYYDRGDRDRAIADYTRAIKLDPKYADFYYNRVAAYLCKEDYDRAIADYTCIIKLVPKFAAAYYSRGYAYYNKEDYDQAIADYTRAIELDPIYANLYSYSTRGSAYREKGDYDRAIADYTRAIELDPECATTYFSRGVTYHYGKKDYDRAIADYTRVIELGSIVVDAVYLSRGSLYEEKGDYDRAIADYTCVIKFKPKSADAYCIRGTAYRKKGDYDRAIADYTRAIELDPKFKEAYNKRGIVYYNEGKYKKAWKDIQHYQDIGGSPDPDFVKAVKEKLKGSQD